MTSNVDCLPAKLVINNITFTYDKLSPNKVISLTLAILEHSRVNTGIFAPLLSRLEQDTILATSFGTRLSFVRRLRTVNIRGVLGAVYARIILC